MKIQSLTVKNFKGLKSFTLDADGGNVDVFGENATGKTTLFDAFLWLLFDKDSQNKKDFEIKTLTPEGEAHHGLDHSVKAIFDIAKDSRDLGDTLTLEKVLREKWTKKRGGAEKVFEGHTTDYFVDGVPVPLKDYKAVVESIASEETFKLLTNPKYFCEILHWQDRRRLLLEVCGDLSDDEVIASDKKLAKLPEILNGRKLEDHRKVVAARRSEINKELERIPIRIDEVEQGLPDVSSIDKAAAESRVSDIRKAIAEKDAEITRIRSGGEVAEKTKQKAMVEAELLRITNEHRSSVEAKAADRRGLLADAKTKIAILKADVETVLPKKIEGMEKELADCEAATEAKRNEWFEVDGREFVSWTKETKCPVCGQELPEDQIEQKRADALATFNREKAEKLELITHYGKKLAEQKAIIEEALQTTRGILEKAKTELAEIDSKAAEYETAIAKLTAGAGDATEDPAYKAKLEEKETLERAIAELQEGNSSAVEIIQMETQELFDEAEALTNDLLKLDTAEKGKTRITELAAQEKALAAEYEGLEAELFLTEEFIRAKVALLEEKINSRFKLARFKLFDVQINGGVSECCETLFNGVPYSGGLNNAARINVGLDIINTLSDHYGFNAPIFVDNAEAVTELIETVGQVIRLVVSEGDTKLRVESHSILQEAI